LEISLKTTPPSALAQAPRVIRRPVRDLTLQLRDRGRRAADDRASWHLRLLWADPRTIAQRLQQHPVQPVQPP
jgi:hypothetical protein